jgi:hypothetical protein
MHIKISLPRSKYREEQKNASFVRVKNNGFTRREDMRLVYNMSLDVQKLNSSADS